MIEDAASALRKAEIAVSDLGLRRPTLDDVFLQLTGTSPGGNGATADGRPNSTSVGVRAVRASAVLRSALTRPPRWRRLSPRELRADIKDAGVVSVRNLRHFIRQPDLLIFSTIQPIMFVLLFTYVFGGAIKHSLPHGLSYIDYLLPGILVQSVTFRASQTAVGLSDDLKLGVIDRFRSMPMARSAVLVGRTSADLVRNVLIIVLMIIVGYIIGFRFHAGVAQAVVCIALVSAFGLALSWIFAFVALTVRGAEAAQTAGFVVLFPIVFASSVFVPVSTLPNWLEAIAKVSPVTLTANAARSLALVPGTPSSLGSAIAWIAGLLVAFISLSVWRYRRMT
jgi:ABC-2 type transport system permease protein/oleandomycin transport system permease protein